MRRFLRCRPAGKDLDDSILFYMDTKAQTAMRSHHPGSAGGTKGGFKIFRAEPNPPAGTPSGVATRLAFDGNGKSGTAHRGATHRGTARRAPTGKWAAMSGERADHM
ncbi:hypothetical protein AGMMS49545_11140 [Betaproteobacteria bacterium]|nr:hypothetical protein AGMMS49545_11140 [Betaproteobacteria bacterium]GHU40090.1 hypothetical protein AGMMS50289_01130 [Betaproteobacteria bacterium]